MRDDEFIEQYRALGPNRLAQALGIGERRVHERRAKIEQRSGTSLRMGQANQYTKGMPVQNEKVNAQISDGMVFIGGDAHYWPGIYSTAHRAFVKLIKKMKPRVVIMNGDALDAPSISRHPPIGWEKVPTVEDELCEVQERLGEIAEAAGKAKKIWTLGNHDARFNRRLAEVAPEFRNVYGTRLVHHFPDWEPCWAAEVGDPKRAPSAIVKHRFKGGIHATHNNAMWSGRTMVTGHLHSQKVTPFTDYNGTRWGVDAGALAPVSGPQF